MMHNAAAQERVYSGTINDAIRIAASKGREARIERLRHFRHACDRDVFWEHSVELPEQAPSSSGP